MITGILSRAFVRSTYISSERGSWTWRSQKDGEMLVNTAAEKLMDNSLGFWHGKMRAKSSSVGGMLSANTFVPLQL